MYTSKFSSRQAMVAALVIFFAFGVPAQATGVPKVGKVPTVWSFITPTDEGPRKDWLCLDIAGEPSPYLKQGQPFWFRGSTFMGFGGDYVFTRHETPPMPVDIMNVLVVSPRGETLSLALYREKGKLHFKGSHVENQIVREDGIGYFLQGGNSTKDMTVRRELSEEKGFSNCTEFVPPASP